MMLSFEGQDGKNRKWSRKYYSREKEEMKIQNKGKM